MPYTRTIDVAVKAEALTPSLDLVYAIPMYGPLNVESATVIVLVRTLAS
ncbi:MAG: hypothetical protein ABWY04_11120 [Arthrobacter sp.]